jgi:hypothetical protein
LQEAPGRTVDTRDLLAGAAIARLPPASSLARLSSVGTRSTKLCPNSYKTTKGEGISKKLKIESTNNKRYIKESTHEKENNSQQGADYLHNIQELCGGQWSPPLEPSLGARVPPLQSTQGQEPSKMGLQLQNIQSQDDPSPSGVDLSNVYS